MRPNRSLLAAVLTRTAPVATGGDALLRLARALAPVERAAGSATVRARARRDDDLFYLPFMAVYPGDDEVE